MKQKKVIGCATTIIVNTKHSDIVFKQGLEDRTLFSLRRTQAKCTHKKTVKTVVRVFTLLASPSSASKY